MPKRSWFARKSLIVGSFLLILILIFALLYVSHHADSVTPVKAQTVTKIPPHSGPLLVTPSTQYSNSSSDVDPEQELHNEVVQQRVFHGPNSWVWRTTLPMHRLVIYYGNPLSAAMGPIGSYSDTELLQRLQQQAQIYAALDPAHPVVPALDYVTPVAQPVSMDDGSWVYRMPQASIEHYIQLANSHQDLFFFDMQLGHSAIRYEVNLLMPYLARPGVELALDPEFDMAPGDIPGQEFGRMTAAEINWTVDQLSQLVQTQHLPPKILIIHQFREDMLPDWQKITPKEGVQIITCVDGFGDPGSKKDDYRMFNQDQLIQYPGMKLFYTQDQPLMSPSDVLHLQPTPMMVMYQ